MKYYSINSGKDPFFYVTMPACSPERGSSDHIFCGCGRYQSYRQWLRASISAPSFVPLAQDLESQFMRVIEPDRKIQREEAVALS